MIEAALRRLARTGLRRGLGGGSRAWMVVLLLVTGVRALRRLARPEEQVLHRARLRPGDRFTLTTRLPD